MIYLDYNATSPIAPEVADAMRPFLTGGYGNPSSAHPPGREARAAVDAARAKVAALIGAKPGEIVFTSGGTESNNTVLKGVAFARADRGRHIVTTVVEHAATVRSCDFLERQGWRITRAPVDGAGLVDPDAIRRAITPETALISVMHAQNEVGTIEPIAEIGRIAREAGVPCHTDAAQSLGKVPVDVAELNVDFVSMAGHKLYAPKGIGALYVREGVAFEPLMHGVAHESGRRAGTESTLLIVGLGAACESAARFLADETNGPNRLRRLRDDLHHRLSESLSERVHLNGHPERRLPNTLNVSFDGWFSADLLARLEGVCASTGSACHAGSHEPSPVLSAMGLPRDRAACGVRFSLGRGTSSDEIQDVANRIVELIRG